MWRKRCSIAMFVELNKLWVLDVSIRSYSCFYKILLANDIFCLKAAGGNRSQKSQVSSSRYRYLGLWLLSWNRLLNFVHFHQLIFLSNKLRMSFKFFTAFLYYFKLVLIYRDYKRFNLSPGKSWIILLFFTHNSL